MAVTQVAEPIGVDAAAATLQSGRSAASRKRFFTRERLIGAAAVVVVVGVWQMVVTVGLVGSYLLASPVSVVHSLYILFAKDDFIYQIGVSGYQFALGYAFAAVTGIMAGLLMGWYRPVSAAVTPLASALYATPSVALIPLFVVWFGVGDNSKIAMVYFAATWPVLFNTMAGVRTADKDLLQLAHAFGASSRQLFKTVLLPTAVPFIMTGLRLALGVGVILTVVGEMLAGTNGIGYVIENAGQTFEISQIFAGIVVVAVSATILMGVLRRVERRFDAWRPTAH